MSTPEGSQARWHAARAVEDLEATRRGPQRPLEHLARLRHAHEAINSATSLMVTAARSEGASWSQIGDALGISRQAARQANARREALAVERTETKQWNLPLPTRRPRFRWLPRRIRRARTGRRAA